jgi:hypothetical protein
MKSFDLFNLFKYSILFFVTLIVFYYTLDNFILTTRQEVKNVVTPSFDEQDKELRAKSLKISKQKAISIIGSKSLNFTIREIYAVVFFGRHRHIEILLKYLEANVKENGGILDKIVFAVKTNNKEDLNYLDEIMKRNKTYIQWKQFTVNKAYGEVYGMVHDDDLMFKIDDDICFIANGTFERMIYEYLSRDRMYLSANVVNHPLLSFVHARLRAILAFHELENKSFKKIEDGTEINEIFPDYNYDAFSKWWSDPKAAAVAHESLIFRVRNDQLDVYDFNLWDFHSAKYTRWSINFFLTRGKYVNKIRQLHPNLDDDELLISEVMPRDNKKHAYALGKAVVAHFSYNTQREYLEKTNLLSKYKNLAEFYLH